MARLLSFVLRAVSLLLLSVTVHAVCHVVPTGPISFHDKTKNVTVSDPVPLSPGDAVDHVTLGSGRSQLNAEGTAERLVDLIIYDDATGAFCFQAGTNITVAYNGVTTFPATGATITFTYLDLFDSSGISGLGLSSASVQTAFQNNSIVSLITLKITAKGSAGNLLTGTTGAVIRLRNIRLDATSIPGNTATATVSVSNQNAIGDNGTTAGASCSSVAVCNIGTTSFTATGVNASVSAGAPFVWSFNASPGAFHVAGGSCISQTLAADTCASGVANDIATGSTSLILDVVNIPAGMTVTFPSKLSTVSAGGGYVWTAKGGVLTNGGAAGVLDVIYDTTTSNPNSATVTIESADNADIGTPVGALNPNCRSSGGVYVDLNSHSHCNANPKIGVRLGINASSGTATVIAAFGPGILSLFTGDDAGFFGVAPTYAGGHRLILNNRAFSPLVATGRQTYDISGLSKVGSPNDPLPGCGNNSTVKNVQAVYTAPDNGVISADTSGADYVPILAAWANSPGGNFLGCSVGSQGASSATIQPAVLHVPAQAGVTYYFGVSSNVGDGSKAVVNLGFQSGSPISSLIKQTSLPHAVRGGGYVTKLTITNMTKSDNQVVVNFLENGTVATSESVFLPPSGTTRIATPESERLLATTDAAQWVTVGSNFPVTTNLFYELENSSGQVINSVGFNDAPPITSFVIPVEFEKAVFRTVGLALSNPSPLPVTVTLTIINSQGATLISSPVQLGGFGKTAIDIGNTDPFRSALPNANFVGTLVGSASAPVDVLALGDDQGPFFATPPFNSGTQRLVLPHVVVGGGYVTKITLANLTKASNNVSITYYNQGGQVLTASQVAAFGLQSTATMPPSGTVRIATAESTRFGTSQFIWAVVTPTSAIGANLFFEVEDFNTHAVINTIGFNQVPELTSFTFPIEMEPACATCSIGRTMGLALANAGSTTANATLTLLDGHGNFMASTSVTLPPLNQTAFDFNTISAFTKVLPKSNFVGSVQVTSDVPISGLALEDDLGPFSAVPPVAGVPQ